MHRRHTCRMAIAAISLMLGFTTTVVGVTPLTVFKLADEWGTINPSGPRSGVNGVRFWNAEGSSNGNFASTAPFRFYTADMITQFNNAFGAGQWVVTNVNIVFSQSNASFTSAGGIEVYWFANDALQITNGVDDGVPGMFSGLGVSALRYSSGANALDTTLSDGTTDANAIFGDHALIDTYDFTSNGSAGDWPLDVLAPQNPDTTYLLIDPESLAIQIGAPNYGIATPIVNPDRPFRSDTLANFDAYTQRVNTELNIAPLAQDLQSGSGALSLILIPASSTAATYKGNAFNNDYPPRIYVTAEPGFACPAVVQADFDGNCKVDGDDYDIFEACKTGSAIPYDAAHLPEACTLDPDEQNHISADFDDDGDVDPIDFSSFQKCISGNIDQTDGNCAD